MPLTRAATDVIGALTIIVVALAAILGLLCIHRCFYFQLQIQKREFSQLSYFNGPWIIRIFLIIISIWCGFGEIVRLSFLRGSGRPLFSMASQKNSCKFYILSNLGFAEPIIFLMLGFLLHAALQKKESDSLTRRWNPKTFVRVILLCLPLFVLQLILILLGPTFKNEEKKIAKFFMTSSFSASNLSVCTYPLLSTIILGMFDLFVIVYVVYIGARMLFLVINKGLRLRVYLLSLSIILFLPLRVLLLGFSVLTTAGNMVHEVLVFVAFLMLLLCSVMGICMLVYLPVTDSLALRNFHRSSARGLIAEMIPFDDYYSEGVSLIAVAQNQKDDSPVRIEERSLVFPFAPLHIVSLAGGSSSEV